MSKKKTLVIAKTIVFSMVATIVCAILRINKYPDRIAIPAGIGIATVTLAISEQKGGIDVNEDKV
jgi:hypothetical protein